MKYNPTKQFSSSSKSTKNNEKAKQQHPLTMVRKQKKEMKNRFKNKMDHKNLNYSMNETTHTKTATTRSSKMNN